MRYSLFNPLVLLLLLSLFCHASCNDRPKDQVKLKNHSHSKKISHQLIEMESDIQNAYTNKDFQKVIELCEKAIQIIPRKRQKSTKALAATILSIYAKSFFFGWFKSKPDLKTAFLLFKAAAALGNEESQFFISLFEYYALDGTNGIISRLDQHIHSQTVNRDKNQKSLHFNLYLIMKRYLLERSDRLSYLHSYFSALSGHKMAQISLAKKYRTGTGGVSQDCAKSVLWYKDVAFYVVTESSPVSKFVERFYLQKEIFNMNFNAFGTFR